MAMFGSRQRTAAENMLAEIARLGNPPAGRPTENALREASRNLTGRNRPQRPSVLDAPRFDGPPVRGNQAQARSYTPTVSERIGGLFGRATGSREAGNSLASLLSDWTPIGNLDGVLADPTLNSLNAQLSVLPLPGPARRGVAKLGDLMQDRIRAYHGSPHDFDRFSLDRVGTGEGNQAFGHGLYFAENEGVARGYRDQLGRGVVKVDGQPFTIGDRQVGPVSAHERAATLAASALATGQSLTDKARWVREMAETGGGANASTLRETAEILEDWSGRDLALGGSMYEVGINARPEHMLDWDSPLGQQPQQIQDAVSGLGIPLVDAWQGSGAFPHVTGQTLYRQMAEGLTNGAAARGVHADASARLRDAGVPGIRYFDRGSRVDSSGTRNFVVFDDSLIEIMRKYGLGGLMGAGVAGAAAGQGEDRPIY